MKFLRLLIFIFLYYSQTANSQNWPKIYGDTTNTWCHDLIQMYDKGYLIDAQVDPGQNVPQIYAWLIKTDINGNTLWTRTIASSTYYIAIDGIDNCPDGGIIATGSTSQLDPGSSDIIFLKFNTCGEKEWCNIITTPGNDDYGIKIHTIAGGYMGLVAYFQDLNNRIWLFKLDFNGNIIWAQLINQSNSNLEGCDAYDFMTLPDQSYIITGDGYDHIPNFGYSLRPVIIRADSNGNVIWTLPYGHNTGFFGDNAKYPNLSQSGFYYMSAGDFRNDYPYGSSPCFLKVSPNGQEVYYRDLISNSITGGAGTLNLKNSDSLFISGGWQDTSHVNYWGIFKCDTLGNISKIKIIPPVNNGYGIMSSIFTFDDNYLAAGITFPDSNNAKVFLYKFTSNLEYAPLNTQPRTYDSLCSHPIISDTTSLDDCAIITDIQDPSKNPEKYNLIIYPNPVKDKMTIELPQYLQRNTSSGSIQITTIYHQWKNSTLEIYNLFGKLMYSKEIPKTTEKIVLDVSSWNSGMYAVRELFMNEVVANAKFVVEK